MGEINVARRSSDGREVTYCVTILDGSDRTRHNVTVGHNELYGFADHTELLMFAFARLLERKPDESIISSFRLKHLLQHDADLRDAIEAHTIDPQVGGRSDRERDEALTEWLTA